MKKCIKCQVDKTESEFAINRSHKDGLSSYCKLCNSANARAAYSKSDKLKASQKTRAAASREKIQREINELKSSSGCAKCPERDFRCLDYHHVDASNKYASVSNMVLRKMSIEKIKLEIAKCIILCANCHRKEHASVV